MGLVSGGEELRIAGFGACMISGYPHKAGGMLEIARALIERDLLCPVQCKIVGLAACPAPRAEKHLKRSVLGFNPNYVVIQFGSTDAAHPIWHRPPTSQNSFYLARDGVDKTSLHDRPATVFTRMHWEMTSAVGYLTKPGPVTPLNDYTAAIEAMVRRCSSAGAIPVVLSPFIYGSRYSTRKSVKYTTALRHLADLHDMILVDCASMLRLESRAIVLLRDGVHLSLVGHELIGRAIAQEIIFDYKARNVNLNCSASSGQPFEERALSAASLCK